MARFNILTFLILVSLSSYSQEARIIKLQKPNDPPRLENFHIITLTDDRKDPSVIGYMQDNKGNKIPLNLMRGAGTAIMIFITSNTVMGSVSAAVEFRITELSAITKPAGNGQQLSLNMSIAFLINKRQLIEYKVKATDYAKQGQDITDTIARLISKNIIDRLKEFDGWWAKKQNEFIVVDTVQVEAVLAINKNDRRPSLDPYLMSYTRNRPLKLDDFIGKPDPNSPGDAATYSGISSDYDTKTENGRLIIIAHITPFFDKYRSWVRPNSRNANTLEHEQHHLDITVIQACNLVQELNKHIFLISNYKEELKKIFDQKIKDERDSQSLYDDQTSHGRINATQLEWNQRLKVELKELPCFK